MNTFLMVAALIIIAMLGRHMLKTRISGSTLPHIRQAIVAMLPKDAKAIAELGAGWGGMSAALNKARPEAHITAFELSFLPYLFSRQRANSHITVLNQDFLKTDFSRFDTLYCFLTPALMIKLAPLIPSGMTVLCSKFPMPGWQPQETRTMGQHPAIAVFRYKAP